MKAGPHLANRLRRWWHLRLLQIRIKQLAALAAELEADIVATHGDLASVRMQLAACRARLAAATVPRRTTTQPFTWGL